MFLETRRNLPLMLVKVDDDPSLHSPTQGYQQERKETSSPVLGKTSHVWREIQPKEDSQLRVWH